MLQCHNPSCFSAAWRLSQNTCHPSLGLLLVLVDVGSKAWTKWPSLLRLVQQLSEGSHREVVWVARMGVVTVVMKVSCWSAVPTPQRWLSPPLEPHHMGTVFAMASPFPSRSQLGCYLNRA